MSDMLVQIYERQGRMEATLSAISDLTKERQAETREGFAGIRSEIANIKHEARSDAQVVSMRLEKLEKAGERAEVNSKRMEADLAAVRAPVDELVSFRRRMTAVGMAAMSVGSVLFVARDSIWAAAVFIVKATIGAK